MRNFIWDWFLVSTLISFLFDRFSIIHIWCNPISVSFQKFVSKGGGVFYFSNDPLHLPSSYKSFGRGSEATSLMQISNDNNGRAINERGETDHEFTTKHGYLLN